MPWPELMSADAISARTSVKFSECVDSTANVRKALAARVSPIANSQWITWLAGLAVSGGVVSAMSAARLPGSGSFR